MKYKLKKTESFSVMYVDDCLRIQKVLRSVGIDRDLQSVERIWEGYSDGYCAGWLRLPKNDEDILSILVEEVD